MTMARKMQNKISFGPDAQVEHAETGKGFGMIGVAGGALKVNKAD